MFYWAKSPVVTIITEKSYRELLQQNQVHPNSEKVSGAAHMMHQWFQKVSNDFDS